MTFTTNAAQVDYLRLAVLDWFDGERWSRPPRGQLRGDAAHLGRRLRARSGDLVRYDVRVGPLAGHHAAEPERGGRPRTPRGRWRWDQRSTLPESVGRARDPRARQVELAVWPAPWDAQSLRDASVRGGVRLRGLSVRHAPTRAARSVLSSGTLAAQVTQGRDDALRPGGRAAAVVHRHRRLPLLHRYRGRLGRQRARGVPSRTRRLLRAVRCDDGADGPDPGDPRPGRRRVHLRPPGG